MKRILLFVMLSLFGLQLALAQDTIVRQNGTIIPCKITKEDSASVYFKTEIGGKMVETFLDKLAIKAIKRPEVIVLTGADSVLCRNGRYFLRNKLLPIEKVYEIVGSNPEALKLLKKSKCYSTVGTVMTRLGVAVVIFPFATYIFDDKPNWNICYAGGAMAICSIPFAVKANYLLKDAIKIYNDGLHLKDDKE